MHRNFKRLTDFLVGIGVEQVPHTNKSYLAHLIGVYRYLESQGCPEEVCQAGMFHSIYGTERFQGFTLPLARRDEVRALIGERAERLAYLNCAMNRASFDHSLAQAGEPYRITDRTTGQEIELSQEDFDDLCRVHLFDWLEQVARSQDWNCRRAAYRRMAERLGERATKEYEHVFTQEKVETQAGGASGRRGAALLFVICIAPGLHASEVRLAPPKRGWQPVDLVGTASDYWFSATGALTTGAKILHSSSRRKRGVRAKAQSRARSRRGVFGGAASRWLRVARRWQQTGAGC